MQDTKQQQGDQETLSHTCSLLLLLLVELDHWLLKSLKVLQANANLHGTLPRAL